MRRRVSIALGVLAAVLLAVSAAAAAGVQKEEKAKTSPDRVEGNIQNIDKTAHTFTITVKGKTMQRQVVYDDKTKFTFRNKPATIDELKEGRRAIVLGKLNDKAQLISTRVDVRDEK